MSNTSSVQFVLTKNILENTEHLSLQKNEGAHVCFRGYVRDNNPYKKLYDVVAIEYHCYRELANNEGLRILHKACKVCNIHRIFCIHRIGYIPLQEASIHIEVAHVHRLQAFEAVQYVMNSIKQSLPIWKREITAHGEKRWT